MSTSSMQQQLAPVLSVLLAKNLPAVLDRLQHTAVVAELGRHTDGGISPLAVPYYGPRPSFDNGTVYHKSRASQRNGLRFQGKVEAACSNGEQLVVHAPHFQPDEVKCGPWLYYQDAERHPRFSQPDVLLFSHPAKQLVIIECKLNHTRYAWAQYKHYQGLLRLMYPTYSICGIEVCKAIDPMESYAVQVDELKPHPHDFACYLWLS